jgi:hypothetical protein
VLGQTMRIVQRVDGMLRVDPGLDLFGGGHIDVEGMIVLVRQLMMFPLYYLARHVSFGPKNGVRD